MTQTSSLDAVIQRVDGSTAESQVDPDRGQKLVVLDATRQRVLARSPWMSFRDIRHFVVTPGKRVEGNGPEVRLKSPSTSRSLAVRVGYEAWCKGGAEERLVLALGTTDHPGAALSSFLEREVEAFVDDIKAQGRDVAVELETLRPELEERLAGRAEEALGISLIAAVRPRFEGDLEPVAVATEEFEIRPCDSSFSVLVSCETEAEVEPGKKMLALLHHRDLADLGERVQRAVRDFVAESVTLQQLASWRSNDVEKHLVRAVNEALAPLGRRIRFLRLALDLDAVPPETLEVDHEVDCEIRELEERIRVEHRLIIQLEDLGKYRRAPVDDIESWLRERLDVTTRSALFDKTYLDLLWDSCSERIRETIQQEVGEVGYAVQHMVTMPKLEPLTWKDGLDVTCRDDALPTSDSRIQVGMEIVIHGRIPEDELSDPKLRKYLRPHSELSADIDRAVVDLTRRKMHTIQPQRFYTGFNSPFGDGEPSVRELLEESIVELLREQFRLHEVSVVLKPLKSDLTERMSALMSEGPYYLEVDCSSLVGGEAATFHLEFQIHGIARWHLFCERKGIPPEQELAQIEKSLHEQVLATFGAIPPGHLLYRHRQAQVQLADILHEPCVKKVATTFGLAIRINSLRRDLTKGEDARKAIRGLNIATTSEAEMIRRKKLMQELESLYDRRRELIRAGYEPTDPDRESVEGRIDEIHDELAPFVGQQEGRPVPRLPASSPGFDPEDYRRELFPSPGDATGPERQIEQAPESRTLEAAEDEE